MQGLEREVRKLEAVGASAADTSLDENNLIRRRQMLQIGLLRLWNLVNLTASVNFARKVA
jgi:hypothetical protein